VNELLGNSLIYKYTEMFHVIFMVFKLLKYRLLKSLPYVTLSLCYRWSGKLTWGVCVGDTKLNSVSKVNQSQSTHSPGDQSESSPRPIMVMSGSEDPRIQDKFSSHFSVHYPAGAGYKLLCVAQGNADTYLLTKNSIFKWDSCGPHAILRSLGGGLLAYGHTREALEQGVGGGGGGFDAGRLLDLSVRYHLPDVESNTGADRWCNNGGIIAYRSESVIKDVASVIYGV
jgi:inositol polyphosphate 1-phosphatase